MSHPLSRALPRAETGGGRRFLKWGGPALDGWLGPYEGTSIGRSSPDLLLGCARLSVMSSESSLEQPATSAPAPPVDEIDVRVRTLSQATHDLRVPTTVSSSGEAGLYEVTALLSIVCILAWSDWLAPLLPRLTSASEGLTEVVKLI